MGADGRFRPASWWPLLVLGLLVGGGSWIAVELSGRGAASGGDEGALGGSRAEVSGSHASAGAALSGRFVEALAGPGALRGRVLAFETRAPVADARVTAIGMSHSGEHVSRSTDTDADGGFELSEVPAGPAFAVTITARGTNANAMTLRQVEVKRETTNDLGDLLLGRSAVLAGRVVDLDGRPVADVTVRLLVPPPRLAEFLTNFAERMRVAQRDAPSLDRTASGKDGRFAFEDVAPGRYALSALRAGYARRIEHVVHTPDGVVGGELRVELTRAEPLRGRVVDGEGNPVPQAEVAYWSMAEVADGGMYHLYMPVDGGGRFAVPPPDRTTAEIAMLVRVPGQALRMYQSDVARGDVGDLVVAAETAELRILLLAADGHPMPGAFVMVRAMGAGDEEDAHRPLAVVDVQVTDERGEAVLRARVGDTPFLMLTHPALGTKFIAPGDDGPDEPIAVQGLEKKGLGPGTTRVVLRVQPRIRVRGRVLDTEGAPIPDADVALGFDGHVRARSDAEGRFELEALRGWTDVYAMKRGYVPVDAGRDDEEPPEGARFVERDVVLQRAARVVGRVVDEGGRPVPGASVVLAGPAALAFDWNPLYRPPHSLTAGDGTYALDGIKPDSDMPVVATHPAFVDGQTTLAHVEAGAEVHADDIVLRTPERRGVLVVDEEGAPVEGVRLRVAALGADGKPIQRAIRSWREESVSHAVTDAGGRARTPPVPPGALRITGSFDGYADSRVTAGPEDATPRLVMRKAHALEVVLRDPEGKPASALVWIGPRGTDPEDRAWADAQVEHAEDDGTVRFEGLPDVPLRVRIDHQAYAHRTHDVRVGVGRIELGLEALAPAAADRVAAIDKELESVRAAIEKAGEGPAAKALNDREDALLAERDRLRGKPADER